MSHPPCFVALVAASLLPPLRLLAQVHRRRRSRRSQGRRAARCGAEWRQLCLGHHRGPDDRGRASALPAPRPRPAPATGPSRKLNAMGFANVRVEPFDMPVWVRGHGKRRNRRPLPAADGGRCARQQRLDRARRRHRRNRRLRQRRCAARCARRARSAARSSSSTTACPPTRTAPATASSARRAGRARPSPARRARWRSSSARSAPTIIATPHTGVMTFTDGAKPIPAGALTRPRCRAAGAHPEARPAGDDEAGAGEPAPASGTVGQCHRRSSGPRSRRCRRSWSAAISTAGTRAPARSTTAPASPSPPPRPSASWMPGARSAPSASSGSALRKSACSAATTTAPNTASSRITRCIESDFGADKIWKVDSKLGDARTSEARSDRHGPGAARHRHRLVRRGRRLATSAR